MIRYLVVTKAPGCPWRPVALWRHANAAITEAWRARNRGDRVRLHQIPELQAIIQCKTEAA